MEGEKTEVAGVEKVEEFKKAVAEEKEAEKELPKLRMTSGRMARNIFEELKGIHNLTFYLPAFKARPKKRQTPGKIVNRRGTISALSEQRGGKVTKRRNTSAALTNCPAKNPPLLHTLDLPRPRGRPKKVQIPERIVNRRGTISALSEQQSGKLTKRRNTSAAKNSPAVRIQRACFSVSKIETWSSEQPILEPFHVDDRRTASCPLALSDDNPAPNRSTGWALLQPDANQTNSFTEEPVPQIHTTQSEMRPSIMAKKIQQRRTEAILPIEYHHSWTKPKARALDEGSNSQILKDLNISRPQNKKKVGNLFISV